MTSRNRSMGVASRTILFICILTDQVSAFMQAEPTTGFLKPQKVGYCSLMLNLDTFDDRLVTVRGVYRVGRHAWVFNPEDEDGCAEPVWLKGHTKPWPASMNLLIRGHPTAIKYKSLIDFKSVEQLMSTIFKLKDPDWDTPISLQITVTGIVMLPRTKNVGYGNLRTLPAEMLVLRVDHIDVRPK